MKTFEFSIVMAAYNVEPYLPEALESLRRQSLGFERIQVILVDDGSTDDTGKICDQWMSRYPDNVTVLHQENGGVSRARNAGIPLARGTYINFMDADDRLTENALEKVLDFFRRHGDETDVVSIPVHSFGAQEGETWENRKFADGPRVIDLKKEYQIRQAAVNSSFLSLSAVQEIRFDPEMPFAEDFKYMIQVLRKKETLGVADGCGYEYRVRGTGSSATEKRHLLRSWYTTIFDRFYLPVTGAESGNASDVPRWIQFGILWDMRCRAAEEYEREMRQALSEEEQQAYRGRIRKVLSRVEDEVIAEAPEDILEDAYRAWVVKEKHPDWTVSLEQKDGEIRAIIGKIPAARAENALLEICEVTERAEKIRVEGLLRLLPLFRPETIRVISGGRVLAEAALAACPAKRTSRFREPLENAWSFQLAFFPGERKTLEAGFEVGLEGGASFPIGRVMPGKYLPVSEVCADLAVTRNWKYIMTRDRLQLIPYGTAKDAVLRELAITRTMLRAGEGKTAGIRGLASLQKRLRRKPVWLISDRINKADDNGEAMFRYLCGQQATKVKACFVISEHSPDYRRLKKTGTVVRAGSLRHRLLALNCEAELSSSERDVFDPFGERKKWVKDLIYGHPFVFLQHGITRGNVSGWLNKWNQSFAGFVTAAHPEYQQIQGSEYGYSGKEVWLTGFPRFDLLEDHPEKWVTLMPTWRKNLMGDMDPATGQRQLKPGFEDSEYYRFYHALLNDPRLLSAAEKQGYRLALFLHPQMAVHAARLGADQRIRIYPPETPYRELFAKSSLVVTDYSSAAFDFAYLRKPVIYAQFDRSTLLRGGHIYAPDAENGIREELGPVTETVEDTVREMIRLMENGCVMEPLYRERADRFFAYADRKNRERVYEKTREMLQERGNR